MRCTPAPQRGGGGQRCQGARRQAGDGSDGGLNTTLGSGLFLAGPALLRTSRSHSMYTAASWPAESGARLPNPTLAFRVILRATPQTLAATGHAQRGCALKNRRAATVYCLQVLAACNCRPSTSQPAAGAAVPGTTASKPPQASACPWGSKQPHPRSPAFPGGAPGVTAGCHPGNSVRPREAAVHAHQKLVMHPLTKKFGCCHAAA